MRRATNITTYQSDNYLKTMFTNIISDNLGPEYDLHCALPLQIYTQDATGTITYCTKSYDVSFRGYSAPQIIRDRGWSISKI